MYNSSTTLYDYIKVWISYHQSWDYLAAIKPHQHWQRNCKKCETLKEEKKALVCDDKQCLTSDSFKVRNGDAIIESLIIIQLTGR